MVGAQVVHPTNGDSAVVNPHDQYILLAPSSTIRMIVEVNHINASDVSTVILSLSQLTFLCFYLIKVL